MSAPTLLSRRQFNAALAAALMAPLAGCGGGADAPPPAADPEPRFTFEGLAGRIVRRLRPSPLGVLAASDDGAYRRGSGGWQPLGLAGLDVQDLVALSATRLLAAVNHPDGRGGLFESNDAGGHWQALVHDFGGDGGEPVHALAFDAATQRLYATGADALARSLDGGRHWELLAGQWQAFARGKEALAVDPVRGDVWYGGQDAIEGLALFRWRAAGGPLDAYPGLMHSPSTAKAVRFVMGQPQRVLVSGEGGVVQTRDDGRSWQPLLDAGYRFHFDVLQDPNRPQRLVTAGWDKEFELPQRLVVEVSDDDGERWRRIEHPDRQLFGGVWSLAVVLDHGRSAFLLGLYRGGVMRLELD